MISIIIPAHNEAKVIAATLREHVPAVAEGELEVIVVCNGCSDNTAEVVYSFGNAFKCIETSVPSKTNALNIGDRLANGFPRFYLDADVVLSQDAVRQVACVLHTGKYLAAAPSMKVVTMGASWLVRAYYDIWMQLPYVKEGMIGTGVYALSEEGRKRFDSFPQVIADDGYVRALFKTDERTSVATCCSLVRCPADLAGLLKIKTRSRIGGYELKLKFPELIGNEEKKYGNALSGLFCQIYLWPKILVYLYVNIRARFRAKKHVRTMGYTGWERDESSRKTVGK